VDVNYLNESRQNALDCAKNNKHGQREGIANRLKEKGVMGTKNKINISR
jgi:predicted transcriptional regulator YheO